MRLMVKQKILLLLCLFCLGVPCSAALAQQGPEQKKIFVLHSYHSGLGWVEDVNDGLYKVLLAKDQQNLELHMEYMDAQRLDDSDNFQLLRAQLTQKYRLMQFAAVIAVDDIAINFLARFHGEIFPGAAILFCGKIGSLPPEKYGVEGFAGVVENVEVNATIAAGLSLYPDTKEVVVINDRSVDGILLEPLLRREEANFPALHFEFLTPSSMDELVDTVKGLSGNTIVLLGNFTRDESGGVFTNKRSSWLIASRCKVPIFSMWDFYLGSGPLGGRMVSGMAQGEMAAKLAMQVVWGELKPGETRTVTTDNYYAFDYNEMRWFDISYGSLPEKSTVTEEPQSVLWKYKKFGWTALGIALALEAMVIVLSVLIYRSKKAEAALEEHRNTLEEVVHLRTLELSSTNRILQNEIEERKKVEAALLDSEEVLHQLSNNLLTVQENERQRISVELHDELGQSLAALKLQLRAIVSGFGKESLEELSEECEEMRSSINVIIENVRRLSRNLSPVLLDDLGIDAALEHLISHFAKLSGMEATIDLVEINHYFGQNSQRMIYRIVQESLNNMSKHADATAFTVQIEKRQNRIFLVVKDNGKGFNVEEIFKSISPEKGMGLTAMAERVRILRGSFDIESEPGHGTAVHVTIPV
ncbi:MAG: sensor histidine kinase [Proteobacteria bacterium]|nr:sensor histidine kinase [Pseudomonadota bacterium]MBU1641257.1 sensor histidine kinase [Pseudomonadota bacterium]